MRRYSQRSINDVYTVYICKVNNMYTWSMIGQMIPPTLHEAPLKDCCCFIVKTGTIWTGKGHSFSWCKFHDHMTYR